MSKFRKNQWIFHVISIFLGVSLLNHSQSTQNLIPNPAQSSFFLDQLDSLDLEKTCKIGQTWRPFAAPDSGEKDTKGNNGERGILIVTNLRSADASHCDVIPTSGYRSDFLEPRMMYFEEFWRNFYSFFFFWGGGCFQVWAQLGVPSWLAFFLAICSENVCDLDVIFGFPCVPPTQADLDFCQVCTYEFKHLELQCCFMFSCCFLKVGSRASWGVDREGPSASGTYTSTSTYPFQLKAMSWRQWKWMKMTHLPLGWASFLCGDWICVGLYWWVSVVVQADLFLAYFGTHAIAFQQA